MSAHGLTLSVRDMQVKGALIMMQYPHSKVQADSHSNQYPLHPAGFCIIMALWKRWAWFIATLLRPKHLSYTSVPFGSQLGEQHKIVRGLYT